MSKHNNKIKNNYDDEDMLYENANDDYTSSRKTTYRKNTSRKNFDSSKRRNYN